MKAKNNPSRDEQSTPVGGHVEIMDTTLRDGEQTEGISIMPEEKLLIAQQLLKEVKVDRIEVASARVSAGERTAVKKITDWAKKEKLLDRVEVLGFVDFSASVDWVRGLGGKVINLLTKGSEKHCREQLRRTPEQHINEIARTVQYGIKHGISFNIYLEDWSNGMGNSPDYVDGLIAALNQMPVRRIMLCDTLGILNPAKVREYVGRIAAAFPDRHFDYHGHNDYGLATANSLEAVMAGARGIHVTTNGLGERAGNTSLDEVVVALNDHAKARTGVNEKALKDISHLVEIFTGRRVAANKPITGENVYTQTAGIHADGDMKGNLYASRLSPARFGRNREYAMGKLMGKASLDFNLEKLKIKLTPEQKKQVLDRIVELGDQKKVVTTEDLPFIIADVLESPELRVFEVVDYSITSNRGLYPTATIKVVCGGKEYQASACGDGGYDAFMKALKSLEKAMGLEVPKLLDYEVHIPPGGKTDALVETTIHWEGGLKTRAVHSDQLAAAIEATTHAMNIIALNSRNGSTSVKSASKSARHKKLEELMRV
ncbi:2-isopropylmalate synthase [Candidatus Sumerlaeota bacterium]|nr:2-isopropylmalate synthase [Candidatus Sumerlaeota bacterium]